jgi:Phage capsid family
MASAPVGHPAPFPWATHDWSSVLLTKLAHESVPLSSGASFFPVDGGSLTIPKLTVAAAAAARLDPGEEFPTDNVEGDSVKLTPKKLGLVTAIDVEAIEDADVNTLDVVGDSLARAIAQKLDARLFSTAAADKGPAGLLGRARERRRRLLDPELGGVQRVLGRRSRLSAHHRSVGQLRRGWAAVSDRAQHRLGRTRALGGAGVHLDQRRRDLERAGDDPAG